MRRGGDKCVFMPWLGEYGVMLMYWVRYIHNFNCNHKIVCCRRGDEAYFPSAAEYYYDWEDPLVDAVRNGSGWTAIATPEMVKLRKELTGKYKDHEIIELFRLPIAPWMYKFCDLSVPLKPMITRGLTADVVLGCRKRQYNPNKNWRHWETVAEAIQKAGRTIGLVGRMETSFDLRQASVRAWDYDDASANIELLSNCKLYVGTDTGTTHLASMLNVPMIVFRDNSEWEMLSCIRRTTKGRFMQLDAWNNPDILIDNICRYIELPPTTTR